MLFYLLHLDQSFVFKCVFTVAVIIKAGEGDHRRAKDYPLIIIKSWVQTSQGLIWVFLNASLLDLPVCFLLVILFPTTPKYVQEYVLGVSMALRCQSYYTNSLFYFYFDFLLI